MNIRPRHSVLTFAPLLLCALVACTQQAESPDTAETTAAPAAPGVSASVPPTVDPLPVPPPMESPVRGGWETTASDEGAGLFFDAAEGEASTVQMFCDRGGRVVVNVPAFRPRQGVAKLSVLDGVRNVALGADPNGDAQRGGVSGEGPLPADFSSILQSASGLRIVYGDQNSPPLPAVPSATANSFIGGCAG